MVRWQFEHRDRLQDYQEYYESTGCWPYAVEDAPQPTRHNRRLLHLYGQLLRLRELVDSGTIMRLYGADLADLENLATIEDTRRDFMRTAE